LLLGEPWYEENKAAYNYLANTYTIKQDNMYVLHPMEKKLFRSWRNERLLKLKKQKEAMKKETEAATIITAFVQPRDDVAVLKAGLKPRTVSLEEGEDDVAPSVTNVVSIADNMQNYTPSYFWSKSEENDVCTFTLDSGGAKGTHTCMNVGFLIIEESKKEDSTIMFWRNNKVAYQFEKDVDQGGDQGCYYFGRSRPPEHIKVIFSRFLPWRLLCLREIGWGPPTCIPISNNVQGINTSWFLWYLDIFLLLSRESSDRLFSLLSKMLG
jgi:hypothetical protein